MVATNKAERPKVCACCGSDAGRWAQWWNRDNGWGICGDCVDWMLTRPGESAETVTRAYGEPGVHYPATPRMVAALAAVALGRSPTEPGTARLAADLGE